MLFIIKYRKMTNILIFNPTTTLINKKLKK